MTILEAKKFARNKTLKGTAVLLTILILLFLLEETRGDFANGILFFMDAIVNIHTLILLTIFFGLTYFLAGKAGEEVIIKRQNILLVTLRYVVIISIAISTYTIIIGVLKKNFYPETSFMKIMSRYFLVLFLKTAICLSLVWLWATNKMKAIRL
jgi:hypothetical protein